MKRHEWLLIYFFLPSAKKTSLIDPIRIMKGLFLFKMSYGNLLADFYSFKPYFYGPCSFEIYDDLLMLKMKGLVDEYKPPLSRWSYYRLTEQGGQIAKELIKKGSMELIDDLKKIKMKVTGLTFLNLLKEVYSLYPEYSKVSLIKFGDLL